MGFDLNRFVNLSQKDKEMTCAICYGIYERPIVTSCRHIYCEDCILKWLRQSNQCPIDKSHIKQNELKKVPLFLENLLSDFLIHCDFRSNGCPVIVKLENLQKHSLECSYQTPDLQPSISNFSALDTPCSERRTAQSLQRQSHSNFPVIATAITVGLGLAGAFAYFKRESKDDRVVDANCDNDDDD